MPLIILFVPLIRNVIGEAVVKELAKQDKTEKPKHKDELNFPR